MGTATHLRIQRDLKDLSLPEGVSIEYNPTLDPLLITCHIIPSEGPYKNARLVFSIRFPPSYPYQPPIVRTSHHLFHPNITYDGAVCLNILRLDWSPALDLQCIILGLGVLMTEPNGEDALNKEAGELLEREGLRRFEEVVRCTLQGGAFKDRTYDRLIPF